MSVIIFRRYAAEWLDVFADIKEVTVMLRHWCYYQAFLAAKARLETRARVESGLGEEISKVPELYTHIMRALEDPADHVDLYERQFLNTSLLGLRGDFLIWQDRGYSPITGGQGGDRGRFGGTPRSAKTYQRRLETWKRIYDEGLTNAAGETVTYESTIALRMAGLGTDQAPYWLTWNYGSNYVAKRDGYPNYQGIFFLEAGEVGLVEASKKVRRYFVDYVKRSFIEKRRVLPRVLADPVWRALFESQHGGMMEG